jgi:hypothetical protein
MRGIMSARKPAHFPKALREQRGLLRSALLGWRSVLSSFPAGARLPGIGIHRSWLGIAGASLSARCGLPKKGPFGSFARPLSTRLHAFAKLDCLRACAAHSSRNSDGDFDRLKFLEVMFGDEPPLTPAQLIYQRMPARDPVEAAEQARAFLKEKPLVAYYDEILLEGLRLAQADAERGLLDDERMRRIRDAVAEIVDDLAAHTDKKESDIKTDSQTGENAPLAQLEKAEAASEDRLLPEKWRNGRSLD